MKKGKRIMSEAKRKQLQEGEHTFSKDADPFDRIVDHVLEESDDNQVVIGPLLRPPLGSASPHDYFMIASSQKDRGFRCDQITVGDGTQWRNDVIGAFVRRKPIVIHDTDDELYMVRLCEILWPGERITKLRKVVEAERAEAGTRCIATLPKSTRICRAELSQRERAKQTARRKEILKSWTRR
jgi:hypothetical protein